MRQCLTMGAKISAKTGHPISTSVVAGSCWFVSLTRRQSMEKEHACAIEKLTTRTPWNKGKLIGAKHPLRPSHVWSIRTKLKIEEHRHLISPECPHKRTWSATASAWPIRRLGTSASGTQRTSIVTARDKTTTSASVYERGCRVRAAPKVSAQSRAPRCV